MKAIWRLCYVLLLGSCLRSLQGSFDLPCSSGPWIPAAQALEGYPTCVYTIPNKTLCSSLPFWYGSAFCLCPVDNVLFEWSCCTTARVPPEFYICGSNLSINTSTTTDRFQAYNYWGSMWDSELIGWANKQSTPVNCSDLAIDCWCSSKPTTSGWITIGIIFALNLVVLGGFYFMDATRYLAHRWFGSKLHVQNSDIPALHDSNSVVDEQGDEYHLSPDVEHNGEESFVVDTEKELHSAGMQAGGSSNREPRDSTDTTAVEFSSFAQSPTSTVAASDAVADTNQRAAEPTQRSAVMSSLMGASTTSTAAANEASVVLSRKVTFGERKAFEE